MSKIIKENNFKTIISADTAGSAKELAAEDEISIAAIASIFQQKYIN